MEKRADKKARENAETQLLKELKNCVSDDAFDEALKIIEQIDVARIKVAPNLCLIGEVYMHEGMYEAAENVFVRAYDKAPSNRRILSLLTSLYIEMGDYSEAEYYYKEFIGVASRDLHRYILRYRLDKAKGERTAVLIDTLEKLKDYEYMEEWAYELAELYHKSGDDQKAVHECDEIVLWFGHGEYVNKAVRLKCEITGEAIPVFDEDFMSAYDGGSDEENHTPTGITDTSIDVDLIEKALKEQEEKKQKFIEKQEKYKSSENVIADISAVSGKTEESKSSENPAKKSMGDTMQFFENFSENTDYAEEDLDSEDEDIEEDTEESLRETGDTDALSDFPGDTALDDSFSEAENTGENAGEGRKRRRTSSAEKPKASIFDALSADSTMDFWGNTKKKPKRFFKKRSVEEIEQEQREELRRKKLQEAEETNQYIDALIDEDGEKADLYKEPVTERDEDADGFEDEVITGQDFDEDLLSEDDFEDEVIEDVPESRSDLESDDFAKALFSEDDFDAEDDFVSEEVTESGDEDFKQEKLPESGDEDFIQEKFPESGDEDFIQEDFSQSGDGFTSEHLLSQGDADEAYEESEPDKDDDDDGLIMDDDDIVEERVWTEEDRTFINGLFDDTKTSSDIFSAVPNIDYVKEQLSMTFTKFEDNETNSFDILASYDINFVVLADDKSLKSQISLGIAKALNTYGICDKEKIVRASAHDLNQRDFSMIFDKLKGGCLIIEKADLLSDESAKIIEDYVNQDNQQTAIVFSSIHDEMMKFWKKHQTLRSKFLNVINVSKYNEMELVTLAKGYIEQRKYEMDPEAALVLRDYFKRCIDSDKVINYEDVMSIVDMAVSNLENRNVKNLFMTVLDNKYEEAKMFRLIAEDFRMLKDM